MLEYVLHHLPFHLGRAEQWDSLQEVLDDLTLVEIKCSKGLAGRLAVEYEELQSLPLPGEIKQTVQEFARLYKGTLSHPGAVSHLFLLGG